MHGKGALVGRWISSLRDEVFLLGGITMGIRARGGDDHCVGCNRAAFPLLGYVVTGRKHCNNYRDVSDGLPDSEHSESRC
jgi:hypothetical protein